MNGRRDPTKTTGRHPTALLELAWPGSPSVLLERATQSATVRFDGPSGTQMLRLLAPDDIGTLCGELWRGDWELIRVYDRRREEGGWMEAGRYRVEVTDMDLCGVHLLCTGVEYIDPDGLPHQYPPDPELWADPR